MSAHESWPWTESLGGISASYGSWLEIRRILFGLVTDRCSRIGLREGLTIRCRDRGRDRVIVELPSGEIRSLELQYAWFVQVRPIVS